jgi:CDP-diacylglycerol---glycerol-3-phosphate 3-phosphatidyltransferase
LSGARPKRRSRGEGRLASADRETFLTAANAVTAVRTVAAVTVAMAAASYQSLALLLVALGVYWVGDIADGAVARLTGRETRIGAVFDILSDRLCAAAFYVGLTWLYPSLWVPVAIYLAQFMVVDTFLSLAFLAWPISSPNYFYVVDRTLWKWNWSRPGKVVNSGAFAVLLVLTQDAWLGAGLAAALFALKAWSTVRLSRLGLPIPGGAH